MINVTISKATLEHCQRRWWRIDEYAALHHDTESWRSWTAMLDATCQTNQQKTGHVDDTAIHLLHTHKQAVSCLGLRDISCTAMAQDNHTIQQWNNTLNQKSH